MPLHDWSNVDPGLFHHFHQGWACELCAALNHEGTLPVNLSTLIEKRIVSKESDAVSTDIDYYANKANRVVIRHRLGKIVAFIEIVSPGNKDGGPALRNFVEKIAVSLRQGVHVLVIDPFPPTPRDPSGIHKAIWDCITDEEFDLPADQNRVLASYEADGVYTAYIETVGVGETLPDMPLFIAPGAHVKVPLESSYMAAWNKTPASVRRLVGSSGDLK